MSRISTGFNRIGIVLAAPLLFGAAGTAIYEWWAHPKPLPVCKGLFDDLVPNGPKCRPIAASAPADQPWLNDPIVRSVVPMPEPKADYRFSIVLGAAAAVLYLLSRGLGWVISGFVGEPKK